MVGIAYESTSTSIYLNDNAFFNVFTLIKKAEKNMIETKGRYFKQKGVAATLTPQLK